MSGNPTTNKLPILNTNGIFITDPTEVANTLGRFYSRFTQTHHSNTNSIVTPSSYVFYTHINFNYNMSFTPHELRSSIKSSGHTAVGPDNIHYSFFEHIPLSCFTYILNFFNHIWSTHTLPPSWSHSIILSIRKHNKPEHQPSSFRPISLTSCLGKLLQRMVAKRLSYTMNK